MTYLMDTSHHWYDITTSQNIVVVHRILSRYDNMSLLLLFLIVALFLYICNGIIFNNQSHIMCCSGCEALPPTFGSGSEADGPS